MTIRVSAGLLLRDFDPTDRRRVEIRLTPNGAETCRKIRQARREARPLEVFGLSKTQISKTQLSAFLEVARAATKPEPL